MAVSRNELLASFGFESELLDGQCVIAERGFGFEDRVSPIERRAFDILESAGCTNTPICRQSTNRPRQRIFGWRRIVEDRGFAEDSPEGFSARILDALRLTRISIRDGRAEDAAISGGELFALVTQAGWKTLADKGLQFSKQKAPRLDPITKLIDAALSELGMTAKATAVWDHVVAHHRGVITESDPEDRMIWAGRKRPTTFKAFQNRLAKRRKKFA